MNRIKRIIPIILMFAVLLGSIAFAETSPQGQTRSAGTPSFTVNGNTVTCNARARFPGQEIDATLELYQGSTLVAWWTKTGTGSVSFSEPAPFISGLSYTLTISGTANGIALTPQSITQTLW